MSKYVGNLIPHTFFVTKGSGESDLELHAGSYHMALHDAGISDFNIHGLFVRAARYGTHRFDG